MFIPDSRVVNIRIQHFMLDDARLTPETRKKVDLEISDPGCYVSWSCAVLKSYPIIYLKTFPCW